MDHPCQKIYARLAPWLSSLAVIGIFGERLTSYAGASESIEKADKAIAKDTKATVKKDAASKKEEAEDKNFDDNESESVAPLGEAGAKRFHFIKTRDDACKAFERRIVTYYDQSSLVLNCKQRPIEGSELFGEIEKTTGKPIIDVPANIYRMIPFGEPFTKKDLAQIRTAKSTIPTSCQEIDGNYVTSNGWQYYYIDKCKKLPFNSYFDLEEHNKTKKPIVTVQEEILDRMPSGSAVKQKNTEYGLLYKVDGDSNWSKLSRSHGDTTVSQDSEEKMAQVESDSRSVNRNDTCKKLNHKVVSNYSQIYFIDNCTMRPVKDFSIRFQQRINEMGGVIDISPEQIKVIPKGREISATDAARLLK